MLISNIELNSINTFDLLELSPKIFLGCLSRVLSVYKRYYSEDTTWK
jgi:hypothetical protein